MRSITAHAHESIRSDVLDYLRAAMTAGLSAEEAEDDLAERYGQYAVDVAETQPGHWIAHVAM